MEKKKHFRSNSRFYVVIESVFLPFLYKVLLYISNTDFWQFWRRKINPLVYICNVLPFSLDQEG